MVRIPKRIIYWDSDVFLAWLLPEADRRSKIRDVLTAAERGDALIASSALTLTEVIKLKGRPSLQMEQEDRIRGFFDREYIKVYDVTRFVATRARNLIWNHNVKPKDSIHVATAIQHKLEELQTFDKKLLGLSGILGSLRITNPGWDQAAIDWDDKDEEEE